MCGGGCRRERFPARSRCETGPVRPGPGDLPVSVNRTELPAGARLAAPAEAPAAPIPTAGAPRAASAAAATVFPVLLAISVSHMLNDLIQSLIPAIYPILKESYRLDFGQIGLITLAFQLTASLLQPVVGLYTDHRPTPSSLAAGMGFTLVGILLLSMAPTYAMILIAVAPVAGGSSGFHRAS